jgi:hypothetical protein
MQLALRRAYGFAYDPFRGMRGLGDDTTTLAIDPSGGYVGAPVGGTWVSNDPIPILTPTPTSDPLVPPTTAELQACLADPNCSLPPGTDPSLLVGMGPTPNTTPGPILTPTELAAEQARASSWLATIPGALSTVSKIAALTTAQIAAGVQSGALKPSSTCPSGYMVAGSAQCAGTAAGAPLIAGISNTTLAIGAVVLLALFMMGSKRR